jgi:hypothetical protein
MGLRRSALGGDRGSPTMFAHRSSWAPLCCLHVRYSRLSPERFKAFRWKDWESVADYFLAFRIFRTLGCFAEEAFDAPAIRKSSNDFPPLMAAVSQRGFNPRPAQVSVGFSGLRYFGATEPPLPTLPPLPPPSNRASLDSSDSSSRRRSVTLSAIAVSTCLANSCNLGMGIVLRAMYSSSFSDEASIISTLTQFGIPGRSRPSERRHSQTPCDRRNCTVQSLLTLRVERGALLHT